MEQEAEWHFTDGLGFGLKTVVEGGFLCEEQGNIVEVFHPRVEGRQFYDGFNLLSYDCFLGG